MKKENIPVKQSVNVNGKNMMLENYLLSYTNRPLPKAPTHYVLVDVLNTDLSVKRITIYFNPSDTWKGDYAFFDHTPQSVGMGIGDKLHFLNADPNTLAYKYWVIEIATGNMVHDGKMYLCTKCEF